MSPRARPASLGELLADLPADADLAVVRDGDSTIVALDATDVVVADSDRALHALDAITEGWWAGFLSYDLGRALERVPDRNPPSPPIPDLLLARFETRMEIGADAAFPRLCGPPLGAWTSSLDRDAYEQAVRVIKHHLASGDCYQVNLTRRLECDVAADPVALFGALRTGNPAPHEALLRIGGISVVSASPERFLRRDGRRIETCPIKGTGTDPEALQRSAKDRAENVMIADLARNDLGRVCEYGSVSVPSLCAVERHPGLWHLVTTVAGRLRDGVGTGEIVRATFPPASVTGCPKPRVLQIIESLEPVRRGVYCGAVGFIDADRDVLDLNVAIRTFTVTGGCTYFGVGGGIVSDSDPAAEWEETELKARRLLAVAAGAV